MRFTAVYVTTYLRTCDGCGKDRIVVGFEPTIDDTTAYLLCVECIHNAARIEKFSSERAGGAADATGTP